MVNTFVSGLCICVVQQAGDVKPHDNRSVFVNVNKTNVSHNSGTDVLIIQHLQLH